MADIPVEDMDERLDYEAVVEKDNSNKEIERLGFDPERFEEIEKEFKQFLEEIIGN